MTTESVVALKEITYAGITYQPGEKFKCSEKDAKLLSLIGKVGKQGPAAKVVDLPKAKTVDLPKAAPVAAPEPVEQPPVAPEAETVSLEAPSTEETAPTIRPEDIPDEDTSVLKADEVESDPKSISGRGSYQRRDLVAEIPNGGLNGPKTAASSLRRGQVQKAPKSKSSKTDD